MIAAKFHKIHKKTLPSAMMVATRFAVSRGCLAFYLAPGRVYVRQCYPAFVGIICKPYLTVSLERGVWQGVDHRNRYMAQFLMVEAYRSLEQGESCLLKHILPDRDGSRKDDKIHTVELEVPAHLYLGSLVDICHYIGSHEEFPF